MRLLIIGSILLICEPEFFLPFTELTTKKKYIIQMEVLIQIVTHIAKIKTDQNRKTHLQVFDMWCKIVREKCRDSKKNFCTMSFFVNPG